MRNWTPREVLILEASKEIRDGDVVFVGHGLPVIIALHAKKTHAPRSVIVHEYGVVGANPRYAVEMMHPIFSENAIQYCDMIEALGYLIYHVNVAILGAGQIDKYGNVNTTLSHDEKGNAVRISGSGGANDICSLVSKFVLIMDKQNPSKLVEKVEYITSPGFLDGGQSRELLGLPGGGPSRVYTNLGIYEFDKQTKEMVISKTLPEVRVEDVRKSTGWSIKVAERLGKVKPPQSRAVRTLRKLDPYRVFLR